MAATTEANTRVVRVTTGLDLDSYLDTPLVDLMSVAESYVELRKHLHPAGLRCPCGEGMDNSIGHGHSKTGYPVYRCRKCKKTYSILSGTIFSGCTLGTCNLLLLMRMVAEARSAEEIGRAVGLHRNSVVQLMNKIQVYSRHGAH